MQSLNVFRTINRCHLKNLELLEIQVLLKLFKNQFSNLFAYGKPKISHQGINYDFFFLLKTNG